MKTSCVYHQEFSGAPPERRRPSERAADNRQIDRLTDQRRHFVQEIEQIRVYSGLEDLMVAAGSALIR